MGWAATRSDDPEHCYLPTSTAYRWAFMLITADTSFRALDTTTLFHPGPPTQYGSHDTITLQH